MNLNNALELCRDLQTGKLSAVDVMQATYRRIGEVNPTLNALVALLDEDLALDLARQADAVPIADRGPLHGLPMAPKDAVEVAGFATSWGFVPWADNVAETDDELARRMREAGAIFIGRSNMPEFGLGSNTFNRLYGRTLNPYDTQKTAGGSSGGAAVALATGMLALADGSDMGGSLRNPASFCNVVGFRPSIGRTPLTRGFGWQGRLATTGPMARSVAECALLFSVQAGPHAIDPLTLPEPGEHFLDALSPPADLKGLRVAYAPRLNDLAVEREVVDVCDAAARQFEALGAQIDAVSPPLERAMDVFQTQRAAGLAVTGRALERTLPDWRAHAKETAVWNIEKGFSTSAEAIAAAEIERTRIYADMVRFFDTYDALILPAAQVPPFDIDEEWVETIDGRKMESYIDWMTICCAITVTACPAISVPGGFTPAGLPVGLQIVGPPRSDLDVLRIAHAYEVATEFGRRAPEINAFEIA